MSIDWYQDKVRELTDRIATLEAENEKFRNALKDIQARSASGYFIDATDFGNVARAALTTRSQP